MKPRILLLSGTSEGRPLARLLLDRGFAVTATVTRDEACESLFGELAPEIEVLRRGFSAESLAEYLRQGKADMVLDATHPFAARITSLATAVCEELGVPYVRYERPDWQPPVTAHAVDDFAAAAEVAATLGRRLMLTIGSKQLKHFAHLHDRVEMFARILPSVASLEQALAAGFRSESLLCLRPPFSREFNRSIFEEFRVDVLVTKASGVEGGVVEKVEAAEDLGMQIVIVRRPELANLVAVQTLDAAVAACAQRLPGPARTKAD